MNLFAQQLGRMARGVKKTLTPEERERRRVQFEINKRNRWKHKKGRKP